MIDKILIALLTGNHILLEGLPGLAKSLTVNNVAETLGLKFSRIQFTPDSLPSDIIKTERCWVFMDTLDYNYPS